MFFQTLSTKGKHKQIHTHTDIYISQKRGLKNITQNTATLQDDLHAVKTYTRRYCKNSDSLLFTIYSSIIWYMTVHSVKWYVTKWVWKGSIPRKECDIFYLSSHLNCCWTYLPFYLRDIKALSLEDGPGTWSWSLQPFTYVVKTIIPIPTPFIHRHIEEFVYFSIPLTFFWWHI